MDRPYCILQYPISITFFWKSKEFIDHRSPSSLYRSCLSRHPPEYIRRDTVYGAFQKRSQDPVFTLCLNYVITGTSEIHKTLSIPITIASDSVWVVFPAATFGVSHSCVRPCALFNGHTHIHSKLPSELLENCPPTSQ